MVGHPKKSEVFMQGDYALVQQPHTVKPLQPVAKWRLFIICRDWHDA